MNGARLAARLYDPLLGPLVAGFRRDGLELAAARPGLRVLDVGCGTGAHLDLYRRGGAHVAGVDTSEPMLSRARRRLGIQALLVAADASALPFPDERFDVTIAMTLLHQFEGPQAAVVLGEMQRVTRADGRLLVVDHHPGRPRGLRGAVIRAFSGAIEWIAGGEHSRSFRRFLSSGGVPGLAGKCGLVIERWSIEASGTMGIYLLRRG